VGIDAGASRVGAGVRVDVGRAQPRVVPLVVGALMAHGRPRWGTIGLPLLANLPLLAKLYVRAKDVPPLALWHDWTFRTKLELAGELLKWATFWPSWVDRPIWVVVDGGPHIPASETAQPNRDEAVEIAEGVHR